MANAGHHTMAATRGATTTGPDATPPPAICQHLRGGGGGSWDWGGGVGVRLGGGLIGSSAGGGAVRDPLLPHAYLKGVCVSRGMGV